MWEWVSLVPQLKTIEKQRSQTRYLVKCLGNKMLNILYAGIAKGFKVLQVIDKYM